MSEPLSRAEIRKLNLENIEREQRREEDCWQLEEGQLAQLSSTFQTVQTEFHDLDGLVWSQSDTRLDFIRHRNKSLPSYPSPKSTIRYLPKAKPMSPLTNFPLPPIPLSNHAAQHRSPAKGLFHPVTKFSPSVFSDGLDTIRPKTARGRERAKRIFSNTFHPASPSDAIKNCIELDSGSGTTRSHTISFPIPEDPDSTIVYDRPPSAMGFVDMDDMDHNVPTKTSHDASSTFGLGSSTANPSRPS